MIFTEEMSYDAEPICEEAARQRRLLTYGEARHPRKYDHLPPGGGHALPHALFFVSNRSFERSNFALSMVVVNQDTLLPGVSGLHGLLDTWIIPGTEHMSEVERWGERVREAYLGYTQELA